jgi:FtsP/CotA-like multicopper oxidase with cupredoxin domain
MTDSVVPNDNRRPAGLLHDGVLRVTLTAGNARWRPDLDVDTMMTVQAFAGEDGVARIPGPLIRATSGTAVRITLRNALGDSTLIVHGLRAGSHTAADTVHVAPGATRVVEFRATRPGTYFYWGTRSGRPINKRWGRDSQLTGVIVIDPAERKPDPRERIFVLTLVDIYRDSTRPPTTEDIWEVAINGLSWPHTERLAHAVGDTVRWRWVNATERLHPIHLHGFHFRVTASGNWHVDTAYAPGAQPEMVTRTIFAGETFGAEWVPTRAGNWLVHCHMAGHMSPYPERPDSVRLHNAHDVKRHPLESMAGLVLGIEVRDSRFAFLKRGSPPAPSKRLRVVATERPTLAGKPRKRALIVPKGRDPAPDSIEAPSAPLVLTRGERTAITVVNRTSTATSIHWHGMELEHGFDGVAGWSGKGRSLAPLVAPGDSFTVAFTPPRSGTFIYHAHMEEEPQLTTGMYGAMLVLDSGEALNPDTDRTFIAGYAVIDGEPRRALNGRVDPPPMDLVAGTTYRLRLININPNEGVAYSLTSRGEPVAWRLIAKDGAMLPPALARELTRPLRSGVGETYDFTWTPTQAGEVTLQVVVAPAGLDPTYLKQALRVRAP